MVRDRFLDDRGLGPVRLLRWGVVGGTVFCRNGIETLDPHGLAVFVGGDTSREKPCGKADQ